MWRQSPSTKRRTMCVALRIDARRVFPSNGKMRLCVYNATHLASAMEINKFISAALGLVRFLFWTFGIKGTPLT